MCLWQGKSFACMLSTQTAKSDCGWTIVKHLLALVQGRKWQPKSKPYFLSVKKWQKHISILRHEFNQWTLSINTLTRCWESFRWQCAVSIFYFFKSSFSMLRQELWTQRIWIWPRSRRSGSRPVMTALNDWPTAPTTVPLYILLSCLWEAVFKLTP